MVKLRYRDTLKYLRFILFSTHLEFFTYLCFAECTSSLRNFIPGTIRLSVTSPTFRTTVVIQQRWWGNENSCVTVTNTLEQPVGSLFLSFLSLSNCIFSLSGMKESM